MPGREAAPLDAVALQTRAVKYKMDGSEGTRITFIQRLASGSDEAWTELNAVYRPLILGWLRRYQLQASDSEDLVQEVLTVLALRVGEFEHNGRLGAFRNWLRTTTVNVTRTYFRKKNRAPQAVGSDTFVEMLQQLEDPDSEQSREFNREHDQYLVSRLVDRVSAQFQPSTMTAFRMHVVQGKSAKETAAELGLTVTAVHIAKSRVLRRLREEAAEWMGDIFPNS